MLLIAGVLNRITQEDGSLPGAPLGAFKALVYFVGLPLGLFTVIAAVVLLSTSDRKAKRSTLTRIE
jgi:uncharacterized protein involved in exopolysaccharide biosynthesis